MSERVRIGIAIYFVCILLEGNVALPVVRGNIDLGSKNPPDCEPRLHSLRVVCRRPGSTVRDTEFSICINNY